PLAAAQLMFKNVGDASTPNNAALASAATEFLRLPMDAEAFARTGISVRCGSTDDYSICDTHGVNIYLDVMLQRLERQIRAGTYSQERIEEWQKSTREQFKLKSEQEETEYVRQVVTALFRPEHAYTKRAVLTPEAANKAHRESLDAFRRELFTAG